MLEYVAPDHQLVGGNQWCIVRHLAPYPALYPTNSLNWYAYYLFKHVLPSLGLYPLDDLPPPQWQNRLQDFYTWLIVQATKPNAELRKILYEFAVNFTNSLWDWYFSLQKYHQLEFIYSPTIARTIGIIHDEFIGITMNYEKVNRYEFFKVKCCSYQHKDLERHYQKMSKKFHILHGIDDPSLKQVFITFILEALIKLKQLD